MCNAENQTPLYMACLSNDTKTALVLLKNGARVRAYTSTSDSPLLMACSQVGGLGECGGCSGRGGYVSHVLGVSGLSMLIEHAILSSWGTETMSVLF